MRTAIGIVALLALTGVTAPVVAADAVAIAVETASLAVPTLEPDVDWSGFYAGIFGAAGQSAGDGTQLGLGVSAGVNAQLDFVLVGAEVTLQALTSDSIDTAYGEVLGRGGFVLTDDVLLYAAAGYGWDLGGGGSGALAGGGLELAVTDDVSVRAQYLHSFDAGAAGPADQVTLGAAFHF